MRINNNLMAMNTHRQLGINTEAGAKSIEKLSSGLRINRAGDDAAGLAISEKMRGQIRGLDQSSRNAQDSISLVQTAEGALNETTEILQRMRELAVQSASDTNVDADREAIQLEVDQLAVELTRIANDTEFNERTLLDGGLQTANNGELTFHIGANTDQNMDLGIGAMDAQALGVARDVLEATVDTGAADVTGVEIDSTVGTAVVSGADLALTVTNATATHAAWTAGADSGIAGIGFATTVESSEYNDYTLTTSLAGSTTATIDDDAKTITVTVASITETGGNITTALTNAGINLTATGTATAAAGVTGQAATTAGLAADEVSLLFDTEALVVKDSATSAEFTSATHAGVTLTLDGSLDINTAATISIETDAATSATFAAGVTTAASTGGGIDMSTQTTANSAIETINTALTTVSTERAKLGAVQNRLEHTIANLDTSAENLQASESRIRDVDMASEMMDYTKNNILQQAAQSMLAQANSAPEGVLQLLR